MSYPTYSDLELEIQQLEEENKKLREERDSWKNNYMQETRVRMDECKKLREENEVLKEYKSMYEWLIIN